MLKRILKTISDAACGWEEVNSRIRTFLSRKEVETNAGEIFVMRKIAFLAVNRISLRFH